MAAMKEKDLTKKLPVPPWKQPRSDDDSDLFGADAPEEIIPIGTEPSDSE